MTMRSPESMDPALRTVVLVVLLCVAACASADDGAGGQGGSATDPAPAGSPAPSPGSLVKNGLMPFDGVLVGGQPTSAQLEALAGLGYRTVINLRMPGEEGSTTAGQVESLGMSYVAIPVAGAGGVNEENARLLAKALEGAERPVLVHCASGNRVGAIFGMKALVVDGRAPEEALAVARSAGITGLEPVLRERLGLAAGSE